GEGAAMGTIRRTVLLLATCCIAVAAPSARAYAWTITRTSSPVFYIDTGISPQLLGTYVAYQITNDGGTSYADIWAAVDTFTGGVVSLAPTEDGIVHLGAMAAGATKTAFFFLQASGATMTAQSHTVRVYGTRPPATQLASASFSLTVEETIQASANQVTT